MNSREKLIESIKRDTGRTEQEIYDFCERCNISLEKHRENINKALEARATPYPPGYPKPILIDKNGNRIN